MKKLLLASCLVLAGLVPSKAATLNHVYVGEWCRHGNDYWNCEKGEKTDLVITRDTLTYNGETCHFLSIKTSPNPHTLTWKTVETDVIMQCVGSKEQRIITWDKGKLTIDKFDKLLPKAAADRFIGKYCSLKGSGGKYYSSDEECLNNGLFIKKNGYGSFHDNCTFLSIKIQNVKQYDPAFEPFSIRGVAKCEGEGEGLYWKETFEFLTLRGALYTTFKEIK